MSEFWRTAITSVAQDEILVRGYPIQDLVRHRSFGDALYLMLTGDLPAGQEGRLVEAILVSCVDHGLASPSADAVRFVASSGVPLQTAVAAGVSSIGDVHGGAIEPCAKLLQEAVRAGWEASYILGKLRAERRRLPGFGHPVHTADPRAAVLIELAQAWNLVGPHTALALSLEREAGQHLGRRLPMNVDGAVAGLMCDMNIDPALGKAFFIVGRTPGYVAHAYEQMTAERPFKAADPSEITYTGPARRSVTPAATFNDTTTTNAQE
jgi:citrate synthase